MKQFLLVEPVSKTQYPPLGLMKISSWLKKKHKQCKVFGTVGTQIPNELARPEQIFITSLFTWDLEKVTSVANFYLDRFPRSSISIGGVAASLLPKYVESATGVKPHIGLFNDAENVPPDYSLSFGRKVTSSITFTSRGCTRNCRFCCVKVHENKFRVRHSWQKDVNPDFPNIIFWDNNWLASPNFEKDCENLRRIGKEVDFNQGLDARLYTEEVAMQLSSIRLRPIRFAFDNAKVEPAIKRAIELARKYPTCSDIRVYVLYNFEDTPEDLYYRLDLLNRLKVLAFPMEYRRPTASTTRYPGPNWNSALLRAFKLSLLFYYHKGMVTASRTSFRSIYGDNSKQFIRKLYDIYEYDKSLKR